MKTLSKDQLILELYSIFADEILECHLYPDYYRLPNSELILCEHENHNKQGGHITITNGKRSVKGDGWRSLKEHYLKLCKQCICELENHIIAGPYFFKMVKNQEHENEGINLKKYLKQYFRYMTTEDRQYFVKLYGTLWYKWDYDSVMEFSEGDHNLKFTSYEMLLDQSETPLLNQLLLLC